MKKTILFVLAAMLLVVSAAFAQTTEEEAVTFDPTTFGMLNNWGDSSKSVEDMLNSLENIECEATDEEDGYKSIICYYYDDIEMDAYTYTFIDDALRHAGVLIVSGDTESLDLQTIAQTLIDAYDLTSIDTYDIYGTGIDETMEAYGLADGDYSAGATDNTIVAFGASEDNEYEAPVVVLEFFDRSAFEVAE